jgi:hypothetical protein
MKKLFAARFALVVTALLILLRSGGAAQAAGLVFTFDNVFSGTAPAGSPPWVQASLLDLSPGTVSLTITNTGLSSAEKTTELYLNLDPSLSPTALHFSVVGGTAGVTAPAPSTGTDSFKADGDGKYDILFQFGQTPVTAFSSGDYIQYSITGIPGLTSADFAHLSTAAGGHGPFYAAVHVQGIASTGVNDQGTFSGWASPTDLQYITNVPEPSAANLLITAGLLLATRRKTTASRMAKPAGDAALPI